jgi:hypothetical protein
VQGQEDGWEDEGEGEGRGWEVEVQMDGEEGGCICFWKNPWMLMNTNKHNCETVEKPSDPLATPPLSRSDSAPNCGSS